MLSGYTDRQRDLLRFMITQGAPNQHALHAATPLAGEEVRRDLQCLERHICRTPARSLNEQLSFNRSENG
jgi:hypothetical protein